MNSKSKQPLPNSSAGEKITEQALPHSDTNASTNKKLRRRTVLQTGMGLAVVATAAGIGTWLEMHPASTLAAPSASPLLKPVSTDTVVIQWNNVALQAIADTGSGPTIGARVLAIVHTSMYDAWTSYNPNAVATQQNGIAKFQGPPLLRNINTSVSYAAYRALMDLFNLFPSEAAIFNSLMQTLNYDPTNMSTDTTTPIGIGNVAAQAVLTYRHSDGSNQLNGYADTTDYAPVNTPTTIIDPNRWQPLQMANGTISEVPDSTLGYSHALCSDFRLAIPPRRPGCGNATTVSEAGKCYLAIECCSR